MRRVVPYKTARLCVPVDYGTLRFHRFLFHRAFLTMHRHQLTLRTTSKGLVDITDEIRTWLRSLSLSDAMLNIYLHHTSASLLINEGADPCVSDDLENWLARAVIDGDPLFTHREEGDDDMSAHVRVALTSISLNVPIVEGDIALGKWQRIFLWEHRHGPMERTITLSVWS